MTDKDISGRAKCRRALLARAIALTTKPWFVEGRSSYPRISLYLEIGKALGKDRLQRVADILRHVVGGNDYTDLWQFLHSELPANGIQLRVMTANDLSRATSIFASVVQRRRTSASPDRVASSSRITDPAGKRSPSTGRSP